jgi:tetraether lipid synthase
MWFQDLFNYDFRRTEQCIIPYATQEGEISFCAYNTGVGWRNIIEKMHMTATLTKWYEEHGRHEIFAGGKNVKMESVEHGLVLKDELVTKEEQRDLDKLGIAKNAREEKTRARDAKAQASSGANGNGTARGPQKNDAAYDARMASLYREVVLKEKPVQSEGGFIPLGALGKSANGGIKPAAPTAPEAKPEVEEPVSGD